LAVPVLVTRDAPNVVRRVLAAVDLSTAAGPTLRAAERYAALFDAELRVMSVLEPLPWIPEAPLPPSRDYQTLFEEHLEREVWPLIGYPGVTKTLRHGTAAQAIADEAAGWSADLVVLGSHGKGWVDRVLIGSVTERLLNHLPASLLIVPVGRVEASAESVIQNSAQRVEAMAPA
jgi:nucleotide-binding universal stress UspA family protein